MDSDRPAKARMLSQGAWDSASVGGKTSPVYNHKATSSTTESGGSSVVLPSTGHIDGATLEILTRIYPEICVKS